MNATQRAGLLQRWSVVQEELIPGLGREIEGLTPKLTKLIPTLEWARIEEFVPGWQILAETCWNVRRRPRRRYR